MCVAHTHYVFVDVDARFLDAAELELVHQVVVHLFAVDLAVQLVRIERSEAVCQTFLREVVVHAEVVFTAYGDSHVDGTFPVGVGKHFEHHQFALVEGAFRVAVGVSQQDGHVFGDGVAQRFRYFHAGTADSFLVDLHYDAVGRDDAQPFLIRTNPVFEDILQFIRVFSELFFQFVHRFRISVFERAVCLCIHLVDILLYFRTDGDVFVLAFDVFHTVPSDRE